MLTPTSKLAGAPDVGHPAFWLVPLLLGVSIWGIYALVNTEERYVTVAYLCIILTLFAALRLPDAPSEAGSPGHSASPETFASRPLP